MGWALPWREALGPLAPVTGSGSADIRRTEAAFRARGPAGRLPRLDILITTWPGEGIDAPPLDIDAVSASAMLAVAVPHPQAALQGAAA